MRGIRTRLDPNQRSEFLRRATAHNLPRQNTYSLILIAIHAILIYVDLARSRHGDWEVVPGYRYLFFLHVALIPVLLLFIAVCHLTKRRAQQEVRPAHQIVSISHIAFLLVWGASVSGVDQLIHDQITVFVLFAISIAAALLLPALAGAAVYAASFAVFLTLISLFQEDSDVLQGHYINGTVLVVVSFAHEKTIQAQNEQLHRSKTRLEEQNERITEGLVYAQAIQLSTLPVEESISSACPRHFVLWRPRDVVGGDFYYFNHAGLDYIWGVVDCTGHGVPAAFLTMVAHTELRRLDEDFWDPAGILQGLNITMRQSLHRSTDQGLRDDGLDAALCAVFPDRGVLRFAGANLPAFVCRGGTVEVVKPDRCSIGYRSSDEAYTFTNREIEITEGMIVYLASDGYMNQRGGERGFAYGRRPLIEQLATYHGETLDAQKRMIDEALARYQGDEPQTDDVTVIGFKP